MNRRRKADINYILSSPAQIIECARYYLEIWRSFRKHLIILCTIVHKLCIINLEFSSFSEWVGTNPGIWLRLSIRLPISHSTSLNYLRLFKCTSLPSSPSQTHPHKPITKQPDPPPPNPSFPTKKRTKKKKKNRKSANMANKAPQTPTKRLCRILQAVYYLLYKGISKHWFSLDLHILFKRGRLAAKSLKRLTDHHPSTHHAKHYMSVLTCRSMDPTTAVYVPREVEFSCSNTPSFPSLYNVSKPKLFRRSNKHSLPSSYRNDDVSSVTRIFEVLDMDEPEEEVDSVASPSPWISWKTPVGVRQLRVTDSPFLTEEEGEKEAGGVDMEAEEFITWFREQLRSQQYRCSRYY